MIRPDALAVRLPAGDVAGRVQAGALEGTIVCPRLMGSDGEITDLRLTVVASTVTAMTAKPSKAFEAFKSLYEAQARRGSFRDFTNGINDSLTVPKRKNVESSIIDGVLTLTLGGFQTPFDSMSPR